VIGPGQLLAIAIAVLRLVEMAHSRRNTRRLLDAGGVEHGAAQFPLFVALHVSWLLALFALVPADATLVPAWLALALAATGLRWWAIAALGRYWSARVVTIADAPLVCRGPYRWLRHPNYVAVAVEMVAVPLAVGAVGIAVVFGALNLALLALRLRVEARALAPRRGPPPAASGWARGPGEC